MSSREKKTNGPENHADIAEDGCRYCCDGLFCQDEEDPLLDPDEKFCYYAEKETEVLAFQSGRYHNRRSHRFEGASVCKRYTTVKRLVVRAAFSVGGAGETDPPADGSVEIEVEFTGPLPSEGPATLLCHLLAGSSVNAKPVELPRGRKRLPKTDAASLVPRDSYAKKRGLRKINGRRNTNNLLQVSRGNSHGDVSCLTAMAFSNGPGSGGAMEAPSGLTTRSSTALVMNASIISSPSRLPSNSGLEIPSGSTIMPGLITGALASHTSPQQVQHMSVRGQQHQDNSQVLQQQEEQVQHLNTSSGGQQDDVVDGIAVPQSSTPLLGMVSDGLWARGQQINRTDFEEILFSKNIGDTWESNDIQPGLFDPISPPQGVHQSLAGWSSDFNSSHSKETVAGDFNNGNMVMDLCDADNLFHSTVTEGTSSVGGGSPVSARSVDSDADAVAGNWQEQGLSQNLSLATEGVLSMEKVMIEPFPKECDFEGRPAPLSSPRSSTPPFPDGQCRMVFKGLKKAGPGFSSLRVTAHFEVDSVHKVSEGTGPIKIGTDGFAYATVCYPSMREIWPELYNLGNVEVIKVNVVVEIRSDCGKYRFIGPQVKVVYHRTPSTGVVGAVTEPKPLLQGRQITFDEFPPYMGDNPQTPVSYEEYSCFDRLSDMCHSAFRGSGAVDQPSPHYANNVVNITP